eukprot:COSAG01_NODE_2637_length_7327_cov_89.736718_4_plen_372_part_00
MAFVVVLVLVFIIAHEKSVNHVAVAILKITTGMFQILAAVSTTFKVVLPPAMQTLLRVVKVFALDLFSFMDLGCMGGYTFVSKLWLTLLLLPTLLVGVTSVYVCRRSSEDASDVALKMIFVAMFLIYSFQSQTIFQTFDCRDLGSAAWLALDYQVSCDNEEYATLADTAVIGVLVYPVGVPLFTAAFLVKNRHGIRQQDPKVCNRLAFLIGDYKPHVYYWDCIDMLRKVLLTGVTSAFQPGSLFQLVCGIVLSAISLVASAWVQPYRNVHADVFKVMTESSILCTLILCTLLKFPNNILEREGLDESFIGTCMVLETIALPIAGLVISVTLFGFEVHDVHKELAPDNDEQDDHDDGAPDSKRFANPVCQDD